MTPDTQLHGVWPLLSVYVYKVWCVNSPCFIRAVAGDSAHAGLATITTSPFLTDLVMWGCVRLSELPSSFFMMSSMRSLQWEYTVWGCLPPSSLNMDHYLFVVCFLLKHSSMCMFASVTFSYSLKIYIYIFVLTFGISLWTV